MPKVSVVLTSYNHGPYVGKAIESILAQSMDDWELLIWDDASTDNSWDVICSYSDSRIKAFRNPRSMRGVWGINKAITHVAKGQFIAIHHSDDMWRRNKLKQQVDYLDSTPDVAAVFTRVQLIDEQDQLVVDEKDNAHFRAFDSPNKTRQEWLNHFFYRGNGLCHPSVMVRAEAYKQLGGYIYGFGQLGDLHMWVRMCLHYSIHVLEEELVLFRVHSKNKNSSARTPENVNRHRNEFYQILKLYEPIVQTSDFPIVFPQIPCDKHHCPVSRLFLYAKHLIETNIQGVSQLLGLEIISNLLQDPATAQLLWKTHGYDYKSQAALMGSCELFARKQSIDCERELFNVQEQYRRSLEVAMQQMENLSAIIERLNKINLLQEKEINYLKRVLDREKTE